MSNTLRRTQAVVPFGVGAIVDFRREALMAAGLEAWPSEPECRIDDPRLARRLGVAWFRQPPPAQKEGVFGAHMPFVRFPLWHFCPRCRTLNQTKWNEPKVPRCDSTHSWAEKLPCGTFSERKRWRMIPLRFVAACANGHIEDFPWVDWAHSSKDQPLARDIGCKKPLLRLTTTGLAGLVGLVVHCESCGRSRSLLGAAGPDGLRGFNCSGSRPWLGAEIPGEVCSVQPMVLQRGASNLYFAEVSSSILIPPYTSAARKLLEVKRVWETVTSGSDEKDRELRIRIIAQEHRMPPDELLQAVVEKLAESNASSSLESDEDFRYAEYKALLERQRPPEEDFRLSPQEMSRYRPLVQDFFRDVVLVEKLAETRALTDFTRIQPPLGGLQPGLRKLSATPLPWLPAIRVYGEGIFLVLNEPRLAEWSRRNSGRVFPLSQRSDRVARARGRVPRALPPSFFVLHTLAHLLMRRLSFECGYGSSSLRERIYCREGGDTPMAGILVYTAAGDSEGTMGGLVRQGKPGRLESVLAEALADAAWCSSDPLCAESPGQGTDSLNLAACHACALIPETSCEEGNRLLDRISIVGLPGSPELGFIPI